MNTIRGTRKKLDNFYESIINYQFTDIEKMKDQTELLLNYSYKIDDEYGQAFAYLYLAIYYINVHKIEPAQFHLDKAKALCEINDYHDLLLLCYRKEGTLCQFCGDKFRAIQIYGEALNIAESFQDHETIGILYNNIAIILLSYYDYELSKEYFEKAAIKLSHSKQADYYLLQVYSNLIQICCDMHDIKIAQKYHSKAKAIHIEDQKLLLTLKASEIYLFSRINRKYQVLQIYKDFKDMIKSLDIDKLYFISEIILIAQSMLFLDLKEICFELLNELDEISDHKDVETEKLLQKLHIDYFEKYKDGPTDVYEKYYQFLAKSEEIENDGIAKSLKSKMELFEKNQKHSLLLEENKVLQKQAHLDEVTGLYNRRYFDKLTSKLESDLSIQSLGCIMIDVDFFKEYNDTYGHLEGDQILKTIASVLSKHAFEGFYPGRYAGDEFYCLCANASLHKLSQYLTLVFDDILSQHIPHKKSLFKRVSISAGFSYADCHTDDIHSLFDEADQALYQAKEKGRNIFCQYG